MNQTTVADKSPLDEVMLAMDVVDTLRHRELMLARELGAEARDRQMIDRLREIYAGQGLAVSDEILTQGVLALREDRFRYTPPQPGFGHFLARVYVRRGRWGKPLIAMLALIAAGLIAYQIVIRGPQLAAIAALPAELHAVHTTVVDLSDDAGVEADAAALLAEGDKALQRRDYSDARSAIEQLAALHATLAQEYELRIVSRPGELSGVWRIPDVNSRAQNYYLIVEAVAAGGRPLTLPIRNEEDGKVYRVARWGVRVGEETFQAIANDKRDDGIIQQAVVGVKRRGSMTPEYRLPVQGGTITEW
jgi:hypothetical protein